MAEYRALTIGVDKVHLTHTNFPCEQIHLLRLLISFSNGHGGKQTVPPHDIIFISPMSLRLSYSEVLRSKDL